MESMESIMEQSPGQHLLNQQPPPPHQQHQSFQSYVNTAQFDQNLPSQQTFKLENQDTNDSEPVLNETNPQVMQQLMILLDRTQKTDNTVHRLHDEYGELVLLLQSRDRLAAGYAENHYQQFTAKQRQVERDITLLQQALYNSRQYLLREQYEIFDTLIYIQKTVLDNYLPRWHYEQQSISNGFSVKTIDLDNIQAFIEKIFDIIWRIKNQVKMLQMTLTSRAALTCCNDEMVALELFVAKVNSTLERLILNSFVVEKQPPQVMKTNTRFSASVRFLCGNKLNIQMINPTVQAHILSEQNARSVIKYHTASINQVCPEVKSSRSSSQRTGSSQPVGHIAPLQPHDPLHSMTQYQTHQYVAPPAKLEQPSQQTYNDAAINNMATEMINDNLMLETTSESQLLLNDSLSPTHSQQALFQPQVPLAPPSLAIQQANNDFQHQTTAMQSIPNHHQAFGVTEVGYNPDVEVLPKEFEPSGGIINNSNVLEYHEQTGQMKAHFQNMQLKKIKRAEKKGTESVMDEKFILLFSTQFRIADDSFRPSIIEKSGKMVKRGDLLFHILAFSLPVVVIVHGNQEAHAWATVTWHNAFATPNKVLYNVPDRVPWRKLGHVLSEKFRSATGHGLSQQNLKYLASKVYRNRVASDEVLITWSQFSKEPLSDKPFTFWEWFHSIFKLTKDSLASLWKADRIFGFVGKKGCIDLLLGSAYSEPAPVGTFLLRFSETELGGITIAWVSNLESSPSQPSLEDRVQTTSRLSPTNTSANIVKHLEPFYAKDLATRPLADRIRDLKDLIWLYPNILKDDAFGPYYTQIKTPANPGIYVPTILVTTIAEDYRGSHSGAPTEQSVTPNSMGQNSPDGYYPDNVSTNDVMETNLCPYDGGNYYNETIQ